MNNELMSQMYMLTSLTNLNMGSTSSNSSIDNYSYIRSLSPLLMICSPFLLKLFKLIYNHLVNWIYPEDDEIISIRFPVHEVNVRKEGYGKDSSIRQLYSINYLAINDYIKENLNKINGISNLIEILNVNMDYYSDDTTGKNFVLIPSDSTEIIIESENQIYCKIKSNEKNQDESENNKDNKKSNSTDKVKTYELILFCKTIKQTNCDKKEKMILLNKFIDDCVKKYNDKNKEKYEGKHWIYEYYHSYKDEYSGLELKFKEYLFENNKDLDTNIFFEGKEKLIKYVDKFVYNEEEVDKKIINKYEQEYKSIGYTYKATFLLFGYPGCGKTSTIKAILNRTKRHGIIINWNKIKTCEELETIFRNRTINHKEYDARELCYIIEDCDASKNNILLSRKKESDEQEIKSLDSFDVLDVLDDELADELADELSDNNVKIDKKKKDKLGSIEKILKKMGKPSGTYNLNGGFNDDSVNLSCLLNILDGIIELHGVMVIFTTNHPEKLDEAFLRPGRIDFKQEFKRANVVTTKSIICSKFKPVDDYVFPLTNFIDYVLSPAEIQSICFQTDNIDDCIGELVKETEKHMNRIKVTDCIQNINLECNGNGNGNGNGNSKVKSNNTN